MHTSTKEDIAGYAFKIFFLHLAHYIWFKTIILRNIVINERQFLKHYSSERSVVNTVRQFAYSWTDLEQKIGQLFKLNTKEHWNN